MTESERANPYETPSGASEPVPSKVADNHIDEEDWRGNLKLTSNIMRIVSVVCALGAVTSLMQIIARLKLYGIPNGWTWWHTMVTYRAVYIPCWMFLAYSLWNYSISLRGFSQDNLSFEATIERQTKTWLAVALLVGAMLLGIAMAFGLSLRSTT